MNNEQHASTAPDVDALALDVARRFTEEWDPQRRASLQVAIVKAIRAAHAQPAELAEQQGDARAQFEAWHCEKFTTRWQTGAPTRDMHNGVYAEKYGPAEQQVRWEAWQAAWQAALAATGKQQVGEVQGDARAAGQDPVDFDYPEFQAVAMGCGLEDRRIHYLIDAARYGFDEALGQMKIMIDSVGPLYAAPPAQGIDLGQLREILNSAALFYDKGLEGRCRIKIDAALALIDQRDAAPGVDRG